MGHIHCSGFFIDTQSIKNVWTTERKAFFASWAQKVGIAHQHDPLKESIIYRRDIRHSLQFLEYILTKVSSIVQ